jgi:predicted metal-binding protein
MFVEAPATASLVVCSTCRWSKDQWEDAQGQRGGTALFEALEHVLKTHPAAGRLQLQSMACLFACSSPCTVHIRAPGKMGYLLGGFSPCAQDAEALCDYMAAYVESPTGVVAFADWPEGIMGRFIARLPPDGYLWREDPAPPT